MEFLFYIVFCILAALPIHTSPLPSSEKRVTHWNSEDVLIIPLSSIIDKRLLVHHLKKREVLSDIGTMDDSEEGDGKNDLYLDITFGKLLWCPDEQQNPFTTLDD
ncbi:hypothetical protein JTB14_012308 [Gonioctena quinquepunctata]|nr:hypothetical protein JTB14_012308 [Gonioctena quinquepunctata]